MSNWIQVKVPGNRNTSGIAKWDIALVDADQISYIREAGLIDEYNTSILFLVNGKDIVVQGTVLAWQERLEAARPLPPRRRGGDGDGSRRSVTGETFQGTAGVTLGD